ncbi:hypothetical protein L9F63_012904 [Diploptera punctata]|uniref:Ionotropic glutamate receptor C-terminal domain-containing protein n=1 Tax=Diploptera punctata TaxID=6984 RepID=A0AAD8EM85_DIPPU|nr:hypothetical protein L9F63_012904 [Diploptera punctata]
MHGYIWFLCFEDEKVKEEIESTEDDEVNNDDEEEEDDDDDDDDDDAVEYEEVTFEKRVYNLLYKNAFNPETKFLVITAGSNAYTSPELAKHIFSSLWINARVINIGVVHLHLSRFDASTLDVVGGDDQNFVQTYTWTPYVEKNCQDVIRVNLLENRSLETADNNSQVNIFPSKIPNDFLGCKLRVLSVGMAPYIIISNSTDENGTTVYDDNGLGSKIFKLFVQKYNITTVFVEPVETLDFLALFGSLQGGVENKYDFGVGIVPLHILSCSLIDLSVSYTVEHLRMQIPCPRQIPRIQRIVSIFSVVTWIMLIVIYFLGSLTFWLLSNVDFHNHGMESNSSRNIVQCFYNAWAIFLGVSVTEMPRTCYVRLLFIFYVCYCYAMSMVFQAFFTTFLVEPGYGRAFSSYEEIIASNVTYGYIDTLDSIVLVELEYDEHRGVKHRVDCAGVTHCLLRAMFKGDIMLFTGVNFPYYLALKKGVHDVSKRVCFYHDIPMLVQISIGIHKGDPIMSILNEHVQKCLEAGIPEMFWSQLKHTYRLQAEKRSDENDLYFVFTVTLLAPAFILLFCGYVISFIVLIFEVFIFIIHEEGPLGLLL